MENDGVPNYYKLTISGKNEVAFLDSEGKLLDANFQSNKVRIATAHYEGLRSIPAKNKELVDSIMNLMDKLRGATKPP